MPFYKTIWSKEHQTNTNCINNNMENSSHNQIHNSLLQQDDENKKRHDCDFCGKSFSQAKAMRYHIKTVHSSQKVHTCDVCTKTFSQVGHLKTHINVHNGQKDHKCDSCGKAFSQAVYLRIHLSTVHNGGKITNVTLVGRNFLKHKT